MEDFGIPLNQLLMSSNGTTALGCSRCPDLKPCGGLSISAPIYNCHVFCQCSSDQERAKCALVCRSGRPTDYVRLCREVKGWTLDNVSRAPKASIKPLPLHVPVIDTRSRRSEPPLGNAFAVRLHRLYNNRTGQPRSETARQLKERYILPANSMLVIDGVATDQPLENYWGRARDQGIIDYIVSLQPSLVTVPNFSLIADVPRYNDLYNIKRQAIAWHELAGR